MNKKSKDLRMTRKAVLVHPEYEGTLRIEFYPDSYNGVARYKGLTYEASLQILLQQDWIYLDRPNFLPPGK